MDGIELHANQLLLNKVTHVALLSRPHIFEGASWQDYSPRTGRAVLYHTRVLGSGLDLLHVCLSVGMSWGPKGHNCSVLLLQWLLPPERSPHPRLVTSFSSSVHKRNISCRVDAHNALHIHHVPEVSSVKKCHFKCCCSQVGSHKNLRQSRLKS